MRCKKCNAILPNTGSYCPICGTPIEFEEENRAFKKPNPKNQPNKFSLIFLPIVFAIIIASIVLNIIFDPEFLWSVIVVVVFFFAYFTIKIIIFSQQRIHSRILVFTLLLTIIFFVIRHTIGGNQWIYITWFPILFFTSDLLMAIYTSKTGDESYKFLISRLVLYLAGVIPIITAYAYNLSVKWPSIIETAISTVLFIFVLFSNYELIGEELKKFFSR